LSALSRASSTTAPLLVATWCVATCNAPVWRELAHVRGGLTAANLGFLAACFVVATLYVNLQLSLLVFRGIGRPLLALVLVAASIAAYASTTFGVRLDKPMMRNVFETDVRESAELLNGRLVAYVVLLGLLPALLLLRRRIEYGPIGVEIGRKLRVALLSSVCALPIAAFYYPDFASLMRNHRELRHGFAPTNFLNATLAYVKEQGATPREVRPIGLDARQVAGSTSPDRPRLLVLVVGETARAANFSLGGYPRPTNPELAQEDVLYFSDVRSSGTSTAISLPCMFSDLGRAGFSPARAKGQEGLLDVLAHAGFDVVWRDNDSGCKGTCDRVVYENMAKSTNPTLCASGECFDEILLDGLQDRLDRTSRDLVVVLHMHGSHGPGYHLRYPPEFEEFQPACRTLALEDCGREGLVNAYDNTIRYTDHVLARTIDLLERNADRFDAAMLYVSDHGESLGEKGLYLHGMPYWMAPDEQTRVPLIVWVAEGLRARRGLDWGALSARRAEPCSHDNLFHSVLGLLDVETSAYRPELDLFRSSTGRREAVAEVKEPRRAPSERSPRASTHAGLPE